MRNCLPAFLAIPCLTTAIAAQSVPIPTLDTWSTTFNPSEVSTQQLPTHIQFQPLASLAGPSAVSASTVFVVTTPGDYLLDFDCRFATAPGSMELVHWTIAGTATATWTEQDTGPINRDVAQWVVNLAPGQYALSFDSLITPTGIGHVFKPRVERVQGPVLIAGRNEDYQGLQHGDLQIAATAPLANPQYLLFLSSSQMPTGIPLGFGTQQLANPILLGRLGQASWSPSTPGAAAVAYWLLANPTWWQVVEYDPSSPLGTLRLGSATLTERRW